jgi:hypothetical protein
MSLGDSSDRVGGTEPLPAGSIVDSIACVRCSQLIRPEDRFCESCGTDQSAAAALTWSVEILTDRSWFDRLGSAGVQFPAGRPVARLEIAADQVTIGRASASRDANPDIDLSGHLADPGVSHHHAIVRRLDPSRFEVVDLGSTNGTMINDANESVPPHTPTPIVPGDRIRLGAWTTIVIYPSGTSTDDSPCPA